MEYSVRALAREHHKTVSFAITLFCCIAAYVGSFLLRFDFGPIPEIHIQGFWIGLPLIIILRLGFLWVFKVHRGLYRYASIHDAVKLLKAVSAGSLVFIPIWLLTWGHYYFIPRSIYIIEWGLSLFFLLGVRFFVRLWRNKYMDSRKHSTTRVDRVLVVGAGNLGVSILRIADRRFLGNDIHVVGFVDYNPVKHGSSIMGVPVLGDPADVREFVVELDVDVVLFAISEPEENLFENIIASCGDISVRFSTVSLLQDTSTGEVSIKHIRDVRIEDLLGRNTVVVDPQPVRAEIAGRIVFVSGAGGSIGSELSRQIASFSPQRIILFDAGESPLFEIDRELRQLYPALDICPVIGDVKYSDVVNRVLGEHRPDFIYHAAAYKHVPLMQAHPDEAVLNNVRGTRYLAEAARRNGCKHFVMISTDKAVRPTNVMGATKRMCELLIQSMNGGETIFSAVRFGNVLGSNGSVIPIFRQQLEAGESLTVTHPDMTRFFMTIPEAVSLVLQCGVIAEPRDIFVLDMGSPVKIMDLARNMIRLSGLRENVDVSIKVTGLRPGEKMFEELVAYGEALQVTAVPKINVLKRAVNPLANDVFYTLIRRLETHALSREKSLVHDLLFRLISFDGEINQSHLIDFSERCVDQLLEEWVELVDALPASDRGAGKGRVLAITNCPELGEILGEVLGHIGCELNCLTSAEEALELLSADPSYVAVLCDLIMPKMSAWKLQSLVREKGSELSVIAMSCYDSVVLSELLGMDTSIQVLPKPFGPRDFEMALAQASESCDMNLADVC